MEREFSTGELTDSELQRKLSGHRRDMAEAEPGSARWRELELKIAECMTEQADRRRIRSQPVATGAAASTIYRYLNTESA
jgi:hypothetical protein